LQNGNEPSGSIKIWEFLGLISANYIGLGQNILLLLLVVVVVVVVVVSCA
jgi:hypothetical protein